MSFQSPDALFGLVVVPLFLAAFVRARRWRERRTAGLAARGLLTNDRGAPGRLRRFLPVALFALALGLLVVAAARPTATVRTLQRGATVMLTIDVSNSMAARDAAPSRLGAAKAAATAFVADEPPGVRIGVVAFGQGAVIVQPPTLAHDAVLQAIDHLSLGGGTSLATGILTSLDAIAGKTLTLNLADLGNDNSNEIGIGYYGGTTIVVFSDGEDTSETDPVTMARVASTAGVHVETVGVGTAAGTTVQVDGFTVATALDAETLKAVAAVANGAYYPVGEPGAIAALARSVNLHFALVTEHTEITAVFTAAALALLALGALSSLLWLGRLV